MIKQILTIAVVPALLLSSCGKVETLNSNKKITKLSSHEKWSDQNSPSLLNVQSIKLEELSKQENLTAFLPNRPWADSYWPLNRKGIADRWLTPNESDLFTSVEEQISSAKLMGSNLGSSITLSPAEKYDIITNDDNFTMTREGWTSFDEYKDYDGDWTWMGLCHGWAPAAYLTQAPKHSVIARNSQGKEVFFSEGDIRGLLTKAYANNGSTKDPLFIGTRCENGEFELDDTGRIVDGTLFDYMGTEKINKETIYIVKNHMDKLGVIEFKLDPDQKSSQVLQVVGSANSIEGTLKVHIYDAIDNVMSGTAPLSVRSFSYTRGCRDLNPGSFHLALVDYVAKKKQGFVLDVTRENQVWNQPVYGYESKILNVSDFDPSTDQLARFRSKGTVKLVTIFTTIYYGIESGPYLAHGNFEESLEQKQYGYTLEIDKNGYVIGGEWDRYSSAPDFIWANQGELENSWLVNYDLVKKIHACSIDSSKNPTTYTLGDETIQAVNCEF